MGHASFGIVGTGMLGAALARRLLASGHVSPDRLVLANRSGSAAGFEAFKGVRVVTDNQRLADECGTILLAVPPAQAGDLQIKAPDSLIVSVMAGVGIDDLVEITGSTRIVRAMSSPAAEAGLAYTPWVASLCVSREDMDEVSRLFATWGEADEVADEDQIECFTALTGPVPGFVAYFAECMIKYATDSEIDPKIATRAMRQLFLAGGHVLAESVETPSEHVERMIAYGGTTAAGLLAMRDLEVCERIADGLDAAVLRTRTISRTSR